MTKLPLLILCAGLGKRMLDLTKNTPKSLLNYKNKTLLTNTIDFFKNVGCDEFFINTHYLHKNFEEFIINKFYKDNINLIYEPAILGTGGGIKNIFNYTKQKNICVVNSDIFWEANNKLDVSNFLQDFNKVTHCKILLSKNKNFFGLKKSRGDFNLLNDNIVKYENGNDICFYSGLQIISKNVFQNTEINFSMNTIWNKLIIEKNLKGAIINSNILHIGDKNSFDIL